MNKLYFGDCLDVLKQLHTDYPQGFIDLIYIDPPFNSKRNYNILFEEVELKDVKAQKQAFADTWSNISYKDTLEEIKEIDLDLFHLLDSFDRIRISKSAVSYLTTMAIRIWYMHKVLKLTGSFYLHCDPNMSHYLKIICDLIFGAKNFKNEITWKRASAHNDPNKYGNVHDNILFYSKSKKYTWNIQYTTYSDEYIATEWKKLPSGRFYKSENMLDPQRSMREYDFMGTKARWRTGPENILKLWNAPQTEVPNSHGRIKLGKNGKPIKRCRIIFLDEMPGTPLQTVWTDVLSLRGGAKERLGYPTQKPEALLDRIIEVSSNKGELIADFFCGCGTTVAVAERLKRKWLGVDISHLAIGLIEKRLFHTYGRKIKGKYEIHGVPKDLASAKKLAHEEGGRLKFQDWVIESMIGGVHNPKRTADGGWDGHLTFDMQGKKEIVLIEVKSGNVNVKNLREFIHVFSKQNAAIGVFVCFGEQVTKPMQLEAKEQGYFKKELFGNRYDKIQIITIEDLLDGKEIERPVPITTTFKTAQKSLFTENEQEDLFDSES